MTDIPPLNLRNKVLIELRSRKQGNYTPNTDTADDAIIAVMERLFTDFNRRLIAVEKALRKE